MGYQNLKSFKIRGYKCFLPTNDYQGFDIIKPINIIIGKNNSGKSKILEFMKDFVEKRRNVPILKNPENILIRKSLEEKELQTVFRQAYSGGEYASIVNHRNHWEDIGIRLVGKTIESSSGKSEILDHDFVLDTDRKINAFQKGIDELRSCLQNPFQDYEFLSIQAERDLKRETVNFSSGFDYILLPDGTRLTELIVRCLNEEKGHSDGWQRLVEVELLARINAVLSPDIYFTRLYAKIDEPGTYWEIFLEEKNKGGIKVSDSGSGIKTIIFVMVMLYVVPKFLKEKKCLPGLATRPQLLHG